MKKIKDKDLFLTPALTLACLAVFLFRLWRRQWLLKKWKRFPLWKSNHS